MRPYFIVFVLSFLLFYTLQIYPEAPQERDVQALLEKLKSGDMTEKHDAIWKLGKLGDKSSVEPLIKLLSDEVLKMEAALALAKIGDKAATLPIAGLLQDGSQIVRGIAAEALTTLEDPAALEHLKAAFGVESQEYPKKRILYAIEKLEMMTSSESKIE